MINYDMYILLYSMLQMMMTVYVKGYDKQAEKLL